MKIIFGLGNPGDEYKNTRHNMGFLFVDRVASENNLTFKLNKNLKCFICDYTVNGEKVVLCKPVTYMNLSGMCVSKVINFYKATSEDILVVHDDLDLPVGKIRIRPNGSSGGQKGMQNIIEQVGTTEIKRVRIGISKGGNTINHVLGNFTEDERALINIVLDKADEMVYCFVKTSFDLFMNRNN